MMLQGEAHDGCKLAVFGLAVLTGIVVLAVLFAVDPAHRDILAVTDGVTPIAAVEKPAVELQPLPLADDAEIRIGALEVDLAAATASSLLMRGQIAAQASRIEALETSLAAAEAKLAQRGKMRPRRRAVPDPPASSYLRLQ